MATGALDGARAPGRAATTGRARRWRAGALLVALVLGIAALSLAVGAYAIAPGDVILTLLGEGDGRQRFVLMDLRLPRLVLGILVGAAFGASGAVFQAVLGNPLASPDIIGITSGASVAAVVALLVLGLSGLAVTVAAFAGALVVAGLIHLLSWRGGVTGARLVLTGIAIAFMAQAVLGYLLTRSDVRDAQTAMVWMVGSLNSAGWDEITLVALLVAVLVPACAALAPSLRVLQLGDDPAAGLGVRAPRARPALLLTGVTLAAVATAAAGPLAFVAFVSAPIARRLVGGGGPALLASALVGVVVVTAADFAALHLLPGDVQVPAGVVTGLIGSPYLLWLLAVSGRSEGGR